MDQKKKQLDELHIRDNMRIYQGDNRRLTQGLIARHGWPDFFDLDAWGCPDAPLKYALLLYGGKRFAVTATDGVNQMRTAEVPRCWGYPAHTEWAPQLGLRFDEYPVMIYRHWQKWARDVGCKLERFKCTDGQGDMKRIFYWGAVFAPDDNGG